MAYKKATKAIARNLFMEGKPVEKIAEIMNIPPKTIYNWKNKEGWDTEFTNASSISIVNELFIGIMEQLQEMLASKELFNSKKADAVNKILNAMKRIAPEKALLSNMLTMFQDILSYANNNIEDRDFVDKLTDYAEEFSNHLKDKYGISRS